MPEILAFIRRWDDPAIEAFQIRVDQRGSSSNVGFCRLWRRRHRNRHARGCAATDPDVYTRPCRNTKTFTAANRFADLATSNFNARALKGISSGALKGISPGAVDRISAGALKVLGSRTGGIEGMAMGCYISAVRGPVTREPRPVRGLLPSLIHCSAVARPL